MHLQGFYRLQRHPEGKIILPDTLYIIQNSIWGHLIMFHQVGMTYFYSPHSIDMAYLFHPEQLQWVLHWLDIISWFITSKCVQGAMLFLKYQSIAGPLIILPHARSNVRTKRAVGGWTSGPNRTKVDAKFGEDRSQIAYRSRVWQELRCKFVPRPSRPSCR